MRMHVLNMGSKSLHENCETILARIAEQSINAYACAEFGE